MRVVHVYHDVWPVRGGIEDYLAMLCRAQAAQGDAVTVLCANCGPVTRVENVDGVQFVRAASFGRLYAPFCPSWPGWLHRLAPDIAHVHLPGPLGEWAAWLAWPRRLIVSLHDDYVRPRWAVRLHGPLHRALLGRANAIVVGAPDYADTSPALAELRSKVRIVPYGIAAHAYAAPDAGQARQGILYAGRLCYYKGVEVLLDAAPAIEAPITIAGDGPWRKRLQAQAARQGFSGRITFTGAVSEPELTRLMHVHRVFVFPSTERSESFGLSQLKAMAAGLPVVSTDLPGVSWLNRSGETGLTVPVRDSQALADSLNHSLADAALCARLAAGAVKRAQAFSIERMLAATNAVYQEVLAARVAAGR